MNTILSDVVKWSNNNLMNINWNKTKEMLIGTNAVNVISNLLCISDYVVERVYCFKLYLVL